LREGDKTAMEAIVARWQRPLFAFAWRYLRSNADAEDLVVAVFVRLHEARARLRADTNLSAWLFTSLANLCHNQHRWRRRHPEEPLDPLPEGKGGRETASEPAVPAPGRPVEDDEIGAAVRSAIDELPPDQKTVLLLHHYEGAGCREIAAIVGCSERGVETRLYRARQRLRVRLAPLIAELLPR
jgi:RNA polymerase sigma-70 factor (ECF subfamily)